jgi:hypothetical protein
MLLQVTVTHVSTSPLQYLRGSRTPHEICFSSTRESIGNILCQLSLTHTRIIIFQFICLRSPPEFIASSSSSSQQSIFLAHKAYSNSILVSLEAQLQLARQFDSALERYALYNYPMPGRRKESEHIIIFALDPWWSTARAMMCSRSRTPTDHARTWCVCNALQSHLSVCIYKKKLA